MRITVLVKEKRNTLIIVQIIYCNFDGILVKFIHASDKMNLDIIQLTAVNQDK